MDIQFKVKEMIVVHRVTRLSWIPPPKPLKHRATLSTIQQTQVLFGLPLITDIVDRVSDAEIKASSWTPRRNKR